MSRRRKPRRGKHTRKRVRQLKRKRQTAAWVSQYRKLSDAYQAARLRAEVIEEYCRQAEAASEQVRQWVRELAADLAQRLGRFVAADVVAYWRGLGYPLEDARRMTADTLRFWHAEDLIHPPPGIEPALYFAVVEQGGSTETRVNHKVWGYTGRVVWGERLQTIRVETEHLAEALLQALSTADYWDALMREISGEP